MNVLILMGSPRIHGNTAELVKPFRKELEKGGATVRYIALAERRIAPCKGCYVCQSVQGGYGCVQRDDMYDVADELINADLIVLATPIYSWYCTGEMKHLLDRLYGLSKFYGSATGSYIAGKRVCILATHGYEQSYACSPFETGIQRLCKHDGLVYAGLYSARDLDNIASFQTREAIEGARAFARSLLEET